MQVRFRPLAPGEFPNPTPERDRRLSPFKADWSDTLTLLERELEFLEAKEVVILLDTDESQIRMDGWPRVDAKCGDAVMVMFDSTYGPLRYSTDRFGGHSWRSTKGWQSNLRAIALGLEALRKVNRYGIASGGEQYQGWKQLGAGNGPTTKEQAAKVVMAAAGRDPSAAGIDLPYLLDRIINHPETRARTIREALRNTHPDRGGDPADFANVQAGRKILMGS